MIKRKPTNAKEPPDGEAENAITILASDVPVVEALAARLKTSPATLVHELLARGLREVGEPLPPALVKYLRAHGRPVPPVAKRDPKKHGLH